MAKNKGYLKEEKVMLYNLDFWTIHRWMLVFVKNYEPRLTYELNHNKSNLGILLEMTIL